MKKLVLIIFTTLLFITTNSFSEDNIYFIDFDKVLNNSNLGKKIINELNDINKKNITNFKIKEDEIQKIDKDIANLKNIISKDELNKKIKDLNVRLANLKKEKNKKNKELKEKKNILLKQFLEKINPLIQDHMEKNSITILLDKRNIFIANSKYDITDEVIKIINNL
tara:strand:- start:412 stop:912 length:501 start_codon:yes stop_codon:yes gene_type:complete